MLRNDRRVAIGCWLVAGLPIVATFLQAVIALLGVDAISIPLIGELKQTLDVVEVFDAAGVVFRNNDVAVFGLFILVALSWIGVGVGMLGLHDRQLTYAAAGLVTVFLALFFLVYSPLFWEDVPALQLAGFVAIPVLAVGAIWLSVTSYEWTETLEAETVELLAEARDRGETASHEFQQLIQQDADTKTLEWLAEVTPDAVAEFEETTDAFHDQCQKIQDGADRILEGDVDATSKSRHQRATQLRDEAAGLAPDERAETALETLRKNVAQELRTEFGDLEVTSQYGERYAIRNMGQYNELRLTEIAGPPIQLGGDAHELGTRLADALESGTPLPDVAREIDRANSHIEEMTDEIRRQEATFDDHVSEIETALSDADGALSRIDPTLGERLEEMLFEKRFGDDDPPFPTAIDVRTQVEDAKEALHDCRFERALRAVDESASDADQIKQIVLFFTDSVVPTIEYGSGSIPIPADVGSTIIEKLQPEMQKVYDAGYTIQNGTLHVESTETSAPSSAAESTEESQQSRSGGGPPPEDVLYLLRELRRVASESESRGTATLQLGEYPEKFSDSELTAELAAFCSRQSNIMEVEVPDTEPGYIEVTVTPEESVSRVLKRLCDRYREQYG